MIYNQSHQGYQTEFLISFGPSDSDFTDVSFPSGPVFVPGLDSLPGCEPSTNRQDYSDGVTALGLFSHDTPWHGWRSTEHSIHGLKGTGDSVLVLRVSPQVPGVPGDSP